MQGVRFPVINAVRLSEENAEPKLQTYAFRLKAASQLDEFTAAIEDNKATKKVTKVAL